MNRLVLAALLGLPCLGACEIILGIPEPTLVVDGGDPDRDANLNADARPACEEWTPIHVDGCQIPQPGSPLLLDMIGDWTYDTDTSQLTTPAGPYGGELVTQDVQQQGGPMVQLLSVPRLVVEPGATLRVTGSKPLMVVAWIEIIVEGTIDISSTRSNAGAGANPEQECLQQSGVSGSHDGTYGGGGGGGGFADDGGAGGYGGPGGTTAGAGGMSVSPSSVIRGGCNGGFGGAPNTPAAGGPGGGALQLTALTLIRIDGTIHAGGGGGALGSNDNRGGGGGGSGGYVGLDAETIELGSGAIIAANGGGGGSGQEQLAGQDGADGLAEADPARGGLIQTRGGYGGALNGDPFGEDGYDADMYGGGGGGGSVGVVFSRFAPDTTGMPVVSPMYTTTP